MRRNMSNSLLATAPAEPAAATAPAGQPQTNPGETYPEWFSSIPDDLKAEPSLKTFKDVGTLAKSYIHAQKMIGADKIAIPGKFATEDDWGNVYKKLGLPESVDKYEIKHGEQSNLDGEFVKAFKENAFKSGILPHQAQKLVDFFEQQTQADLASMEKAKQDSLEKNINGLKQEWGAAFEKNVKIAQNVVKKFGDENFTKYLDESGLGNDPQVIKLLSKIGASLGEDKFMAEADKQYAKTPQELNEEINKVLRDTTHPYYNKEHPNHKAAVEEIQKLYSLMP